MATILQTKLLLWKRYIEFKKAPSEFSAGIIGSVLLLAEIYLLYAMPPERPADTLEVFLFPVIMTSYAQKVGSLAMSEKAGQLVEAMKLAGLRLSSYWLSYFIWYELIYVYIFAFPLMHLFSLFNMFLFHFTLYF